MVHTSEFKGFLIPEMELTGYILGDKLVAAHKNVKEGFSNIPAGL